MIQPTTLWIVEDNRDFREAFRRLIAATEDLSLRAEFESYELLQEHIKAGPVVLPSLVVMDLSLPGLDGVDAMADLRSRYPDLGIVVLSSSDAPESVFAAVRAGARGYVVKGTRGETIYAALREAHRGGTYFSPAVARHVLGHFSAPREMEELLSEREKEVLGELASGRSKATIAERLFLSPHTVDSHVRNIYRKLHVTTATEAVAKGVRGGLV